MRLDIDLWNKALALEERLKDKEENVSWTKISNNLMLPERQSRYIWFALKNKDIISPTLISKKPDRKSIERDFDDNKGTITTKSLNIKTVDDAIRESNIDLDEWEIYRHNVNSWEVTMGGDKTKSGVPETFTNYQVKLWLQKKVPNIDEISLNNVIDRLNEKELSNNTNKDICNYKGQKDENVMAVLGLVDIHFGLLAYDEETGEGDYNLDVAERIYLNAVEDGLKRLENFNISKIVIPIGNDFFHINGITNKTPKGGNDLDVSGKLARIFETGEMAVIKAVNRCLDYGPVELIWIPGNHDPQTSYFLCKIIQKHFMSDDRISVDINPKSRKFIKWGVNLIGFTHGDEEPLKNLPQIMVDSCPEWISHCKNKEWLTGHIHKKKQMDFISVDSMGSSTLRIMPSLCSIDQWHYKKGYVGNKKVMEIYTYNEDDGFISQVSVHRRD